MIAVIADDLTGAAELGGIGLSKGLDVKISFTVELSCSADLLIIATDARAKSQTEAVAEMEQVTEKLRVLNPDFIFKKIDSVLRGYVIPEVEAQLKVLGFDNALLVPANPSLGRTIENGRYLIKGVPIAETSFAADPEFPAKTSDVLSMLKSVKNVQLSDYKNSSLEERITVAQVKTPNDLKNWASFSDDAVLLAGSSGFFKAVLDKVMPRSLKPELSNAPIGGTILYVCGSAYENSVKLVSHIAANKGVVTYLSQPLLDNPSQIELNQCCDEVLKILSQEKKAIIAINPNSTISTSPLQLKIVMALLVEEVLNRISVNELVIEGGATASVILRALGVKTLCPVNEFATGIIRCKANISEKLYVTLKPGSYVWPQQVWQF